MLRGFVFIVVIFYTATSVFSQVKQWTDENGVTHFEAQGGASPSIESKKPDTPRKAKTAIERSHAGAILGDNDSSYRNSETWWSYGGEDKFRGQVFSIRPGLRRPDGVTKLGVMFVDGRLAMIRITYREESLGGWSSLLRKTSDKYGPATGNQYSEAIWGDDQTLLSFTKDYRGGVEVIISDIRLMQTYTARSGRAAPTF